MAKILFLVLFLVGCGGPSFTVGVTDEADGGHAADALASTGGAPAVGSGGKVGLSAGGQPGSGGTSSGGAPSSGGALSSGGVVGSTGGETDSGEPDGGAAAGGAPGVADACVLVTHSTGLGQTWQDCVPLGTHNEEQAMKACNAWCAAKNCETVCVVGAICDSNDPPNYVAAGFFVAGNPVGIVGWSLMTSDTVSISNGSTSCSPIGTWD